MEDGSRFGPEPYPAARNGTADPQSHIRTHSVYFELCFGRAVAIRGDRRPAHIQPDIFDLVGGDACSCQLRRVEASRNVEQPATAEIEAGGEEERGSPAAERDPVDNQVAVYIREEAFNPRPGTATSVPDTMSGSKSS